MEKANKLLKITNNLELSKEVNSYNHGEHFEAGVIAHGLIDIEESSIVIIDKLLPLLYKKDNTEESINNTLFKIGEELKHILYHINDMKYYDYIKE